MSDETGNIFHFNDPGESPGYLLWQVSMLWQRNMKAGLDPLGITPTQFSCMAALKWLSYQQEEVRQADIAGHVKIDRMMTSKVLKTLEGKSLITRKESPTDSRVNNILLTTNGEDKLKEALTIVREVDREFFSALDEKGEDFRGMMLALMERNYLD